MVSEAFYLCLIQDSLDPIVLEIAFERLLLLGHRSHSSPKGVVDHYNCGAINCK